MRPNQDERERLLSNGGEPVDEEVITVSFQEDDPEDPKQWPLWWKYIQVLLIFTIALICPMASSLIAPALDEMAKGLESSRQEMLLGQALFVIMLGIGPLFFAPMSETFGRRPIFLTNLSLFTLIQIPTALAPNTVSFLVLRTFAGLFGSVGVANGGGSVSDLFDTSERATVLSFYLLGPLLGPSVGPFLGGVIISRIHWRWLFWILLIIATFVTAVCFFLLQESYPVILLQKRKEQLEESYSGKHYRVEGASSQSIGGKILANSNRAARILLTQPVVLTLSIYQALVFSTMYTMYTNFENMWSQDPYGFDTLQVALTYLAPAIGFVLAAIFLIPWIDKLYGILAQRNDDGKGKPEYRLPLANVGAVFVPASLFWLAWTIHYQKPWPVPLSATLLFGASQVSIFNTVQNYYIDAFEKYAASALAAGAVLRAMTGAIVPLFVPQLFAKLGYGWGFSVFGFLGVALMPAPLLFFLYGDRLRMKFATNV